MKIKRKQMLRLKEVLNIDRSDSGDEFIKMVERDINSLLKEYFDFTQPPTCKIESDGKGVKVEVSLTALRIKPFGVIPE